MRLLGDRLEVAPIVDRRPALGVSSPMSFAIPLASAGTHSKAQVIVKATGKACLYQCAGFASELHILFGWLIHGCLLAVTLRECSLKNSMCGN